MHVIVSVIGRLRMMTTSVCDCESVCKGSKSKESITKSNVKKHYRYPTVKLYADCKVESRNSKRN